MDVLQPIVDATTQTTSVQGSAITLLNKLSALIAANKTDPAKIQAIADQLNASASQLANAVTANTPVTQQQAQATK